jgi:hypothetical protein
MTREELITRLDRAGWYKPGKVVGCTEEEIRSVETVAGGPLPRSYREFLQGMGRRAGPLFKDCEMFYPIVLELTEMGRYSVNVWWEGRAKLPRQAFVFLRRGPEQFLFFNIGGESDDAAIYHWEEPAAFPITAHPDECWSHFTDSFWDVIEGELAFYESYGPPDKEEDY